MFVTASGNPEKYEKAKKSVFYGIIGVIVALVAKGLVAFIKMALGA